MPRGGTQVDQLGRVAKDVPSYPVYPDGVRRDGLSHHERCNDEAFRSRTTGGRDGVRGEDVRLRVATFDKKQDSDVVEGVARNVLHEQSMSTATGRNRTSNDSWAIKGTSNSKCASYFLAPARAFQGDVDTGIGTCGSKKTGRLRGGEAGGEEPGMEKMEVDSTISNRSGLCSPDDANGKKNVKRLVSGANGLDPQEEAVKRRRASPVSSLPTSTQRTICPPPPIAEWQMRKCWAKCFAG